MVRWGIPDWTQAEEYPDPAHTSDRQWRWEFERRQPQYRQRWEDVSGDPNRRPVPDVFGVPVVRDPDHKYVMRVLCDPKCSMNDEAIRAAENLRTMYSDHGHIVTYDDPEIRHCSDEFVDYRFSLAEPLNPQMEKAAMVLREAQDEKYGTKNTARPSRELWPLYLRALDAKECGVSYSEMGRVFWPTDVGDTKSKARRTYELAKAVRDNCPV